MREEDYIDFPCSDTWRDYYWERGLTPRPSLSSILGLKQEVKALRDEVRALTMVVAKLLDTLDECKHPKNNSYQNYKPKPTKGIIDDVVQQLQNLDYNQDGEVE